MQVKWFGLPAVALIAAAIIGYKAQLTPEAQAANSNATPRVLLGAELAQLK